MPHLNSFSFSILVIRKTMNMYNVHICICISMTAHPLHFIFHVLFQSTLYIFYTPFPLYTCIYIFRKLTRSLITYTLHIMYTKYQLYDDIMVYFSLSLLSASSSINFTTVQLLFESQFQSQTEAEAEAEAETETETENKTKLTRSHENKTETFLILFNCHTVYCITVNWALTIFSVHMGNIISCRESRVENSGILNN